MSLLSRLFRRPPTASPKVEQTPHAQETKFAQMTGKLEQSVLMACRDGNLPLAFAEISRGLPAPNSAPDAEALVRRVLVPLLASCVEQREAEEACRVEQDLHPALVKKFEDPRHFEVCLGLMDASLRSLGLQNALPIDSLGSMRAERLLFFVHNLATDFAHTILLCDLIQAYVESDPSRVTGLGIAGVGGNRASPAIAAVRDRWNVTVHTLKAPRDNLYAPLQEVARLVQSGAYDRVVVVSVPVAISYLTGLLPPDRVCWLTMKYQLSCFEHLTHRCSFRSGLRRAEVVGGRRWLQAAPLFNGSVSLKPLGDVAPALRRAREATVLLYTINREEKVRNPQFLLRVARILHEVKEAVFVWTGRERLSEIVEFFASEGLAQRHVFAGWVVPDDLMRLGDLFLDTPVLSGNVAAQATAAGVPVVTDADAITWVGTFWPAYLAERGTPALAELEQAVSLLLDQGVGLQARGDDEYVHQSVLLARDPNLRRQFAVALKTFAARYFFNAARAAEDHFDNLREPIA